VDNDPPPTPDQSRRVSYITRREFTSKEIVSRKSKSNVCLAFGSRCYAREELSFAGVVEERQDRGRRGEVKTFEEMKTATVKKSSSLWLIVAQKTSSKPRYYPGRRGALLAWPASVSFVALVVLRLHSSTC
jgi:hypothetical protein